MHNTFYFLRHEKTKRESTLPISKWKLTEIGEEKANTLAKQNIFHDIDIIFCSSEEKAYQTAKPIADTLQKTITQIEEISELNRDNGGFMEPEEYEQHIKACLTHVDKAIAHWETAAHALERFSNKIDEIDRQYEHKKILIVGHGFTINLYFAKLAGMLDQVYERFNTNSYGDWGVVKDKKIIKDIAN